MLGIGRSMPTRVTEKTDCQRMMPRTTRLPIDDDKATEAEISDDNLDNGYDHGLQSIYLQ